MMLTRGLGAVLALAATLLTAACAPADPPPRPTSPAASTPSPPSPTELPAPDRLPALNDLVITPGGIGSLLVGQPVSATDMVFFDPDFCAPDDGASHSEPVDLGRWITNYPGEFPIGVPFSAHAAEGTVEAIEIRSTTLATAEGIRVGSSLADLMDAYPRLTTGAEGTMSKTLLLATPTGELVFEVLTAGVYEGYAPDTVFRIQINTAGSHLNDPSALQPYFATDSLIGGCL